MPEQWKYSRNGQLKSGVTRDQIARMVAAGELGDEDSVYSPMLKIWQPVRDVRDMLSQMASPAVQAPAQRHSETDVPADSASFFCPDCGFMFSSDGMDPGGLCKACTNKSSRMPSASIRVPAPVGATQQRDADKTPPSKSPTKLDSARTQGKSRSGLIWSVSAVMTAVVVIVGAVIFINRQDWETANLPRILELKENADALARTGNSKEAYYKYKDLFAFVSGHELSGYVKGEMAAAEETMTTVHRKAAAIIAREEQAERQRQAEVQRQEAEARRLVAEQREREALLAVEQRAQTARIAAEQQERERQVREAARQAAAERAAKLVFSRSDVYKQLRKQADEVSRALRLDLIGEDSAYRSMSKRSRAARNMLGIYVKMQGHLADQDVSQAVDQVLSAADSITSGETSAIRAIYENDEAFFRLLGVWCRMAEKDHRGLAAKYQAEERAVDSRMRSDDSAIRAISAYTGSSVTVLRHVLASRGLSAQADKVASSVEADNTGDDSAWRHAMHNAEGEMQLVLILLEQQDAAAARQIGSSISVDVIGDDSALRAKARYTQGTVDVLYQLICAQ